MKAFNKAAPYLAGMAMAVIFGLSFLFTKRGSSQLHPIVLLACRFGLAALVMSVLFTLGMIKVNFKGKPFYGVILLSVFYPALSFLFEVTGLRYVSTSQAGVIFALMPIFVAGLGAILLGEKPSGRQLCFICLSVAGVLLMGLFTGSDIGINAPAGLTFLLVSVLAGALNNVLSRKYSKHFTPVEITFSMIWIGAITFHTFILILSFFDTAVIESYKSLLHSAVAWEAVLYLGIGASVIAFFCMNYTLSKLPAASSSVFTNLSTLVAVAAGILILKEPWGLAQVAGALLICTGVLGTNYLNKKGSKKTK